MYFSIVVWAQTEPLIQNWTASFHNITDVTNHPVNKSGRINRYTQTWIIR